VASLATYDKIMMIKKLEEETGSGGSGPKSTSTKSNKSGKSSSSRKRKKKNKNSNITDTHILPGGRLTGRLKFFDEAANFGFF
jgi:hypothetical protein